MKHELNFPRKLFWCSAINKPASSMLISSNAAIQRFYRSGILDDHLDYCDNLIFLSELKTYTHSILTFAKALEQGFRIAEFRFLRVLKTKSGTIQFGTASKIEHVAFQICLNKAFHKSTGRLIESLFGNKAKQRKYKRDRAAFFLDSKSTIAKRYFNLVG